RPLIWINRLAVEAQTNQGKRSDLRAARRSPGSSETDDAPPGQLGATSPPLSLIPGGVQPRFCRRARIVLLLRRILILEDEYFLAEDCAQEIVRRGMEVIGPFGTVEPALQALADEPPDGAIVDLKTQEGMAFEVVEALRDRGTPFVIYSGYD